jgi:hypothetical protein
MPPALLQNAGIFLVTIVAMEAVAWAVHRYVMHGVGWGWHRSHHEPREGGWSGTTSMASSSERWRCC